MPTVSTQRDIVSQACMKDCVPKWSTNGGLTITNPMPKASHITALMHLRWVTQGFFGSKGDNF